jgi:hypothetical protein
MARVEIKQRDNFTNKVSLLHSPERLWLFNDVVSIAKAIQRRKRRRDFEEGSNCLFQGTIPGLASKSAVMVARKPTEIRIGTDMEIA